jgi:predicted Zn-dependent protease
MLHAYLEREHTMRLMALLTLSALLISGCSTSPTGRSQFIMMPQSAMDSMGVSAYDKIKKTSKIDKDPKVKKYVQCIADNLTQVVKADYQGPPWEVTVFVDDEANAFALPGGKIGVNTGMLKIATTQDELAAVIGHEIAHVIARHSNERTSTQVATAVGVNALAIGVANQNAQIAAALGAGAYFGIELPFSRTQESEADTLGTNYMAKAGFDPQASIKLWEKMGAQGAKKPPEFMLTHPSSETRIERLKEAMPEALELYRVAKATGHLPKCN